MRLMIDVSRAFDVDVAAHEPGPRGRAALRLRGRRTRGKENHEDKRNDRHGWTVRSVTAFYCRADVAVVDLATVIVMLDGYCFEWCTTLRATTPFDSSKLFPPVFRLRSKRGKLLLDTSMRSRCPAAK